MTITKNLVERLIDIQRETPSVKKEADNPYFKSKYANLNSFIEAIMPLLIKHKVLCLQPMATLPDGTPIIKTILTCETGETIESSMPMAKLTDPQKLGAFVTYCRRYSLQALLLLPAVDDDAESFYDRGGNQAAPSYEAAKPSPAAPASRRKWDGRSSGK